jgi:L-lactate permease
VSVLAGLVAVAAIPAGVAVAELRREVELLDAAYAIPLAAAAGLAAVVLARQARTRIERTLGRIGGRAWATVGRVLGVIGLCLATSGTIAVATYYGLSRFAE